MRILAGIAVVLLLVITTTSAYIRLAQTGLSCPDAPHCYARAETRAALDEDTRLIAARLLHRFAASAAGSVLFALALVGWKKVRRDQRRVVVTLLVLAAGLALLGRFTPSALPAVALGNLLGGMAMVGLAGWLLFSLRSVPSLPSEPALSPLSRSRMSGLRPWAWLALAVVAVQIAAGGMIAVRHAAFACATVPDCNGTLWPRAGWGAFDLLREMPPPADAVERTDAGRQAVNLVHRWLAVATVLLVGTLGAMASSAGLHAVGITLVTLAIVQATLGAGQVLAGQPLALAVAHNVVAACMVLALAALLQRSRRS